MFLFSKFSSSSIQLFIIFVHVLLHSGVADVITVQQALGYVPNKPAAIIAAVIYIIISILYFVSILKFKHWWGLCLPIGALGSAFGFITRYILAERQDSRKILTAEQILVLCCPAAFLAFNYVVYGRLLQNCIGARHSLIRPNLISTFFVASDVATFVVQAGGTALVLQSTGKTVVKIGVILQTVSFLIFCALLVWTWWSVKKENLYPSREVWWKAYMVLSFSSVFIAVRAIYRMVASLEGSKSTLSTDEVYLYAFDVLPLMIAIGVYAPFWPGKYIEDRRVLL